MPSHARSRAPWRAGKKREAYKSQQPTTSRRNELASAALPLRSVTAPLLTFEELAAAVPFSRSTLRRLIQRGAIPKYQPGGRRHRVAFHPDVLRGLQSCADAEQFKGPDPEITSSTEKSKHPYRHGLSGPKPAWTRRLPLPLSSQE